MDPQTNGIIRDAIVGAPRPGKNFRLPCPVCEPDRKQRGTKTLSVTMDGDHALYKCHHCDEEGRVTLNYHAEINGSDLPIAPREDAPLPPAPIPTRSAHPIDSLLSEAQNAWFVSRGISSETIGVAGVISGKVWMRKRNAEVASIGFRYENSDGSRATKWRDGDKNFSQDGAARSLWEIDNFSGGDLIIAEGEMDALSFREAGHWATSVPNGAPASVSSNSTNQKFTYLWDAREAIDSANRIILAPDADGPGDALAEEIARRVGRARCWRVTYPDGCKDINDVLVKHGKEAVSESLASATPWPVSGLHNPSEFREEVENIYTHGLDTGISSGLAPLDDLFRVMPQTFTVVTGVPGSGKSALLTWLSVQLANRAGWRSAVFCAETSTQILILQLAAVFMDKPFHGRDKMSREDLSFALDWIADKFVFIDESDTNIDSVIERSHSALLRYGVRILIIDPYNFLTSGTDIEQSTQVINALLVKLKSFAVQHGLAVFLVAHPKKMYRNKDGSQPSPGGYDVNGSASFYNVCDTGLTVARDGDGISKVTCWKSRFPWLGETGQCLIGFNRSTGVFGKKPFTPDDWDDDWGDDEKVSEDIDFEKL